MDGMGSGVPRYRVGAGSDPGRLRGKNEDAYLSRPEEGIFAVIDGVGGQAGGEVAAAEARGVLYHRLSHRTGSPEVRLREAVTNANSKIYVRSRNEPRLLGMACVLTAVILEDGKAFAAHVGDTRLYKIRVGRLRKLSRDHSFVGLREDNKELTEYEAMHHPRRNEILRDVGSEVHEPYDPHFIDIIEEPFEPDTALLLCTDGLTDMVPSRDVLRIVCENAGDPHKAVEALIEAANEAGGKDNVTVIVIEGEAFGSDDPLRKMAAVSVASTPTEEDRDTGAFAAREALPVAVHEESGAREEEPGSAEEVRARPGSPEPVKAISPLRYYLLGVATVLGLLGVLYVLWKVSLLERVFRPTLPSGAGTQGGEILPPSDRLAGTLIDFLGHTGESYLVRLPAGTYHETLYLGEDVVLARDSLGQIRILSSTGEEVKDSSAVRIYWGAPPDTLLLRIGPPTPGITNNAVQRPSERALLRLLIEQPETIREEEGPDSTSAGQE